MSLIDKLTDEDIMNMVINAYNRGYLDGREKERDSAPSGLQNYYGPFSTPQPYTPGYTTVYGPVPIEYTSGSTTFPGSPPLVYTLGQSA